MRLSTDDLGFFFEPRHAELAARLAAIAGALGGEHDAARVARELGARFGLYAWLVPEALGGAEAGRPGDPSYVDLRALCLVREALGYASPLADSIFAVQGLGAYPIVLAGSAEQRARLLPEVVRGARVGAFALTEPEAGSDVASLRSVARPEGGGYVLEGEKTFISNAGICDHYVVFASVDPAAGRKGITAFLVERGAPGLVEEPIKLAADHPIGRLRFAGCRLGPGALVGEPGGGFALAMRTLDAFRVSVGAAAVGMARRALDEALAHVRGRVQFGKPLAEQPLVQAMLADMATELDAARLLVLRAALAKDRAEPGARLSSEAAMAKLYATEAASRVVDAAVQLHGGLGVVAGSPVERLARDVRPLRIYEGTSEIQRLIIGGALARGGAGR
ncbi:MAG TPA: acyl-CoA dehydrogenase family protein [Polyangiaceae bacterium]|nr:acyl-CoA dehydrogenase family protein [Polyangiaceae bacterium]